MQSLSAITLVIKASGPFQCASMKWDTKIVTFQLKPGALPYHRKAFHVPKVHWATICRETERLIKSGVLELQLKSELAIPVCITPKKNETIRFISDF